MKDGTQIHERLNRALATCDWMEQFPSTKLIHISSSASHHNPLSLHMVSKPKKRKGLFCFESM